MSGGFTPVNYQASANHEAGSGPPLSLANFKRIPDALEAALGYDTADEVRALGVPTVIFTVRLRGDQGGIFVWDASSSAGEDGLGAPKSAGTVINPLSNAGSGRWIRIIASPYVHVEWFGTVAADSVNAAGLVAASLGLILTAQKGVYNISGGLIIDCDFICNDVVLNCVSPSGILLQLNSARSVSGIVIDGSTANNTKYAFFVNCNSMQVPKLAKFALSIKNISNANQEPCFAAFFNQDSGIAANKKPTLDISINVTDVTASTDGIVGNSAGAARGIYVSLRGSDMCPSVDIHDCNVSGIGPVEDGDAIHVQATPDAGSFSLSRCYVDNAAKRAFKIQAYNVSLKSCYADCDGIGFDAYNDNVSFVDCHYVGAQIGFALNGGAATIERSSSVTSWPGIVAMLTNATAITIDGFEGSTSHNFTGSGINAGAMQLKGNVTLNDVDVNCLGANGSGFVLTGQNLDFSASKIKSTGFRNGIFFSYCYGEASISNLKTAGVEYGIVRAGGAAGTGDYDMIINIDDSEIKATAFGALISASNYFAGANFNNVRVFAPGGIFVRGNSTIQNAKVDGGGSSGTGVLFGNGSRIANCTVKNMQNGYSFGYTTTAEIISCTAINCTTPFLKTGYTKFIDDFNVSA